MAVPAVSTTRRPAWGRLPATPDPTGDAIVYHRHEVRPAAQPLSHFLMGWVPMKEKSGHSLRIPSLQFRRRPKPALRLVADLYTCQQKEADQGLARPASRSAQA